MQTLNVDGVTQSNSNLSSQFQFLSSFSRFLSTSYSSLLRCVQRKDEFSSNTSHLSAKEVFLRLMLITDVHPLFIFHVVLLTQN